MPKFKVNPIISAYPPTIEVEAEDIDDAIDKGADIIHKLIEILIDQGHLPKETDNDSYAVEAQ